MESYSSLSDLIDQLREEGYTEDFNQKGQQGLNPDDFIIDKYYRFEGPTDPDDESVVYAIAATDGSVKGTLVNGYGIYSDDATNALVLALKERRPDGSSQ